MLIAEVEDIIRGRSTGDSRVGGIHAERAGVRRGYDFAAEDGSSRAGHKRKLPQPRRLRECRWLRG